MKIKSTSRLALIRGKNVACSACQSARDNTGCVAANSASNFFFCGCVPEVRAEQDYGHPHPWRITSKTAAERGFGAARFQFRIGASRAPLSIPHFPLAIARSSRIYARVDALARAYGPWWLCNDVTRPFWQSGLLPGPEREVDMVAIPIRAVAPCPDAVLRGTRLRGRGSRATDPSSLS